MSNLTAVRTNLNSTDVTIDDSNVLGSGSYRIAYEGVYIGGSRNQQKAACKRFKDEFQIIEQEFYQTDFKVVDKAIELAESWNDMCRSFETIRFSRGDVMEKGGKKYLVEPLIRPYYKYTSNNGWIENRDNTGSSLLVLEAFSHFTYHKSGGSLIVCDLQGRFKLNRYAFLKSRYDLTDPAICSRKGLYGPSDLGEKGIESFFANHVCNKFCHRYGNGRWTRPRNPTQCLEPCKSTSRMSSSTPNLLAVTNNTRFNAALLPLDEDSDVDEDSDEDYVVL
jgi:hypothetical protein